jgi:hypothetical protein
MIVQAEYVVKVQVIRSKRRPPRFFMNLPLPLAAALDVQAGELIQWQPLARSDLRLLRLQAPPATLKPKKWLTGFFSGINNMDLTPLLCSLLRHTLWLERFWRPPWNSRNCAMSAGMSRGSAG